MIIFDRLSAHIAAVNYFERTHADWFSFEYLPSYSPELNPVEQCWQIMKNVYMANFIPLSVEHLVKKTLEVAQVINKDKKTIASFFLHAKLKL
jgi:transposase